LVVSEPKGEKVQDSEEDRKSYLCGLINISTDSDYFNSVQWDTGRYGMSQVGLIKTRIGLLAPLWVMLAVACMTNEFSWVFTYATFWGLHIGSLNMFFTLRAGDSNLSLNLAARKRGLIITEIAFGFGLFVTVAFWVVLAPQIYPYLGWTAYDIFMRIHMFTLHCVPFITAVVNMIVTEVKLLENDWWMCTLVCLCYSAVDCIAVHIYGYELYPGWDWTSMKSVYIALAGSFLCGLGYYVGVLLFNHFFNKK
jgi:hypothetical protein